jgi:hypothetical protein
MAELTITYSTLAQGWTSFWSYIPDWMIGMNSSFYTWRSGSLYKHNTNSVHNNFYEKQNSSTLTTIFNQDPTAVKMFKTIELNSDDAWDTTITTDMSTGDILADYYKEKENLWYSYIRRPDDGSIDTRAISTQGIGTMLSYSALVLTFGFNIGTSISEGDKLYVVVSGSLVLLGTIASHTITTVTLTSIGGTTPAPGDMIVFVKNSTAESYGARGYYMEVFVSNSNTGQVELYEVASEAFKSFP